MTLLRREFLGGIVVTGMIAGCSTDFPAGRILDIQEFDLERFESGGTVEVTVRARNNLEPGGFHNVTVVGYSPSKERICAENTGDLGVGVSKETKTVRMNCPAKPVVLGATAMETPCDENTTIRFNTLNETAEAWLSETLECGESLPPE